MENDRYVELHQLPKVTNKSKLYCALPGEQQIYYGHAVFNDKELFKVIQVRKGHIRKKDLTYVLMYKKSEVLLRIDLVGATHRGIPTPHVHIFDDEHDNGFLAIPLDKLEKYNLTEDIIESLQEFLKYNNFDING